MHTLVSESLLLSLVIVNLGVIYEGGLGACSILVHLNLKGGRNHFHVKVKRGKDGLILTRS